MKPKTKKLLKTFIILYVVMLLVAAVATLGWFVFNQGVNVQNGTGVNVVTGNYLRVAIVDGESTSEYGEKVTYTPAKANLVDITGDGTTFYWPQVLNDETDTPNYDSSMFTQLSDETAEEEGYYITFEVSLRGTQDMEVYLGKNSYIHPAEEVYVPEQEGYNRQSMYGDFSADGIAGAMRVSLSDSENNLKQVWIPNDYYRLEYDRIADKYSYTTHDTYREGSYGYLAKNEAGDAFERKNYTAADYFDKVSVGNENLATPAVYSKLDDETVISPALCNGAPVLCTLNEGNDHTSKLRIRIWIEGTDNEAHKALNGGQVEYSLEFVGVPVREDVSDETQKKLESIRGQWIASDRYYILFYDNNPQNGSKQDAESYVESEVLYSFNGIDWTPVNSTSKVFAQAMDENDYIGPTKNIYVRFRETATEHQSEVWTFTLDRHV